MMNYGNATGITMDATVWNITKSKLVATVIGPFWGGRFMCGRRRVPFELGSKDPSP